MEAAFFFIGAPKRGVRGRVGTRGASRARRLRAS
jgi:hypothetical protein